MKEKTNLDSIMFGECEHPYSVLLLIAATTAGDNAFLEKYFAHVLNTGPEPVTDWLVRDRLQAGDDAAEYAFTDKGWDLLSSLNANEEVVVW